MSSENLGKDSLLPIVDPRHSVEAWNYSTNPECSGSIGPCRNIAEDLAVSVAFAVRGRNPKSFPKLTEPFDELFDPAVRNLRERARIFAKERGLYSIKARSDFIASHILLLDVIGCLDLKGHPIAMVPDRQRIYVCGDEDAESLVAMAKLGGANLHHKETLSGNAFRLLEENWAPWLPPEDHPAFERFRALNFWTIARAYHDQKTLLDRRNVDIDPQFVASCSSLQNQKTGREISYCSWTERVPSNLPVSDIVVFCRLNKAGQIHPIGGADWKTVQGAVGHLMELQDMYPKRYFVREFPDSAFLKQLRSREELLDKYSPYVHRGGRRNGRSERPRIA